MKKIIFIFFSLFFLFSCGNKNKIIYKESNALLKKNTFEKKSAIVDKRWDIKLSEKYFNKNHTIYYSAVFLTFVKVKIDNKIIWVPDRGNFSSSNKSGYADVCNYKIKIFINDKNQVCYNITLSQLLYNNYSLKNNIDPIYNNFDDFNKCYATVYYLINESKKNKLEKSNPVTYINDYNPYKSGEYVNFSRKYLFINTDEGLIVKEKKIINPSIEDLKKISKSKQWIIENDESIMNQLLPRGSSEEIFEPLTDELYKKLETLGYQ